jgi:hypothetical protein
LTSAPAFPTFFPEEVREPVEEDSYASNMFKFTDPSITFEENK